MRILTTILAVSCFAPAIVHAQQSLNCGVQDFPTGGCVTPSNDGAGGGFQGYVGAQITFGNRTGATPKFVVGIRDTEVDSDGSITGLDLAVRFRAEETFILDSAVLSGLKGDDDVLGGLGVGYSYTHGGWLVSGAVERDIVRLGVDYAPTSSAIEVYAEAALRTQADEGGVSCPSGFNARDVDTRNPDDAQGDDFFVIDPALLSGLTTCEPQDFGFDGPGDGEIIVLPPDGQITPS